MIDDYSERPSESTPQEIRSIRSHLPREPDRVIDKHLYRQKLAVWRSYNIVLLFIGLIDTLLVFRFFFELAGANPYNAFVQMIYTLSYPFALPFQTIFGITDVARATFNWSILVAIIVYFLIGLVFVKLILIISPVTPDELKHRIKIV
jgi:hypothetical protein